MYPQGGGGVPGPGPYSSPGSNYWPNWESHYAPVEKPRSRLHHRNNYAPPPYSTSMPPVAARDQYGDQYGSYQRPRRTLMDRIVPAIPPSLRRAEALLSIPLTNPMLVPRYQGMSLPFRRFWGLWRARGHAFVPHPNGISRPSLTRMTIFQSRSIRFR